LLRPDTQERFAAAWRIFFLFALSSFTPVA